MASRGRGCAGAGMEGGVPEHAHGAAAAPDALIAEENANAEFLIGLESILQDDDAVGRKHWRTCTRCGFFEPFQGLTEECCAEEGLACSFPEGSIEGEDYNDHSYLQMAIINEHLARLQAHLALAAEAHRGQQQQQQRPTTAESVSMRTSKVVSSTLGSSCGSGLPSTTTLPGASTARHASPFHM